MCLALKGQMQQKTCIRAVLSAKRFVSIEQFLVILQPLLCLNGCIGWVTARYIFLPGSSPYWFIVQWAEISHVTEPGNKCHLPGCSGGKSQERLNRITSSLAGSSAHVYFNSTDFILILRQSCFKGWALLLDRVSDSLYIPIAVVQIMKLVQFAVYEMYLFSS